MADYKEMYLKLFSATEDAINGLIKAQREAEEIYIADSDRKITIINSNVSKKD